MRRAVGLLLTGLGAFLIAFALLLRWWVPGQVIKFPLNEYSVTSYSGTGITYFSPTSLKEYTGVRATATQTIDGDVKSGTSSTAVWGSFTALEDNTNHIAIQYNSQRSAFNRRTGLLTDCCAAAIGSNTKVVQSGQGFVLPFGTQRRTYQIFDVTLLRPEPLTYAGTGTIDGMAALKFVEHITNDHFGQQTLPGPLVGMKDQATVTLPEFLTATNTYWVDPVTGRPIDVTLDQAISLEDTGGATKLVLLGGKLSETAASVRSAVASARQDHAKIQLIEDTGPLIGILAGAIALVLGIVLVWRSQQPWVADYDDDEVVDLTGRAGR
jgi:Porin PorA